MITATRKADHPRLSELYSNTPLDIHLALASELYPDKVALVEGAMSMSFSSLFRKVDACASGLAGVGVGPGDVVTIILPNWWEAAVAIQAALRLGAVINPIVPIYRSLEIGFILAQAAPAAVIIPQTFRNFDYVGMMDTILPDLPRQPLVVVARQDGALPRGYVPFDSLGRPGIRGGAGSTPDSVSLLLYTSGTTADPKGVLHTHETLDYEIRSIVRRFRLGADDTVFMPSPLTHITGLLYGVLMPAMLGATAVYLDIWDADVGLDRIEANHCRFVMAATPFLRSLVDAYEARKSPSSLRIFLCGGADVPPELVRRARKVMQADVSRIYGSSEFPTFCSAQPGDDIAIAADTDGMPIGPASFRLHDVSDGVGELLLKGPEMFVGYFDPSLNIDAFTEDGYFRTGDLARLDNLGAVTICGRNKDIINRGGEKISAKQVEDLLHGHEMVTQAAIVAIPDHRMVEKMCAFVVPKPGMKPTLSMLTRFLEKAGLARQKLPEHLEIVPSLPMTASGKVQKFKLRDLLANENSGEKL